MIEVIEVVVEVQLAPRDKKYNGFCRCGRKWPVGTTTDTIRVVRDSWIKSIEDKFDASKKDAKSDEDKAKIEVERQKFHDELKVVFTSGCVPEAKFNELMAEPMLAKHVIGKPRQVQVTPEIPEAARKSSIFDQFDPAPVKAK